MKRLSFLAPAFLAGCYSYATVQPADVRAGTGVRARITPTAAEQVAPLLGVANPRVLTGTLIESSAGMMIVEVPTSAQALSQRISIAPGQLVELETRRLDRKRTAVVVGAAAFVSGSIAYAALRGGPGIDMPPGGSSTDTRLPLWRVHF